MKKQDAKPVTPAASENLLGENVVLTLNVPWDSVEKEYQAALKHEASHVTLKGFRKGKAPLALAEAAIGKDKLTEHALNHLLPHIYDEEVRRMGIIPLVRPEMSAKTVEEGKTWVFEAATAVAPVITLGDYKALIKQGVKKHQEKHADAKEAKEHEEERLQSVYLALIEGIKPKIAPLLLQEEMNQQVQQLASELSRRNLTLEAYIKSQGKTEEEFKKDLASLALGALQLEFILQEITKDMQLKLDEADLKSWLKSQGYPEETKLPEDLRMRLEVTLLRNKTTEAIAKLANT